MRLLSSAKINIGLHIYSTREDGYHNIESLFYPVTENNSNLTPDVIEIEEGCFCQPGKVRILESGITIASNPLDNICAKAYNLLDKDFNLPPVSIRLEKNIPIGAGLGGGSADGTNTLLAINQLFNLSISKEKLLEYAAMLGSDCPFFIYNSFLNSSSAQPVYVGGRGEILEELDSDIITYSKYKIKLVFSDIFISTQHAYSVVNERKERYDSSQKNLLTILQTTPIEQWQERVVNDFEAPIFAEYPKLKRIKDELIEEGAIYASMSGSGSTIYGIFENKLGNL